MRQDSRDSAREIVDFQQLNFDSIMARLKRGTVRRRIYLPSSIPKSLPPLSLSLCLAISISATLTWSQRHGGRGVCHAAPLALLWRRRKTKNPRQLRSMHTRIMKLGSESYFSSPVLSFIFTRHSDLRTTVSRSLLRKSTPKPKAHPNTQPLNQYYAHCLPGDFGRVAHISGMAQSES